MRTNRTYGKRLQEDKLPLVTGHVQAKHINTKRSILWKHGENIRMVKFSTFKIQYDWYEGEHAEVLMGKKVSTEDFEQDLLEAKRFAEKLIGKEVRLGEYLGIGYRVKCLPEFYEQIIWYLTEKLGYVHCHYDECVFYDIDDDQDKRIGLTKCEKEIKRKSMGLTPYTKQPSSK